MVKRLKQLGPINGTPEDGSLPRLTEVIPDFEELSPFYRVPNSAPETSVPQKQSVEVPIPHATMPGISGDRGLEVSAEDVPRPPNQNIIYVAPHYVVTNDIRNLRHPSMSPYINYAATHFPTPALPTPPQHYRPYSTKRPCRETHSGDIHEFPSPYHSHDPGGLVRHSQRLSYPVHVAEQRNLGGELESTAEWLRYQYIAENERLQGHYPDAYIYTTYKPAVQISETKATEQSPPQMDSHPHNPLNARPRTPPHQTGNSGKRKKLPKESKDKLKIWLADHADHPYPTEEQKKELATEAGMTMGQINNWFINARRRTLPKIRKQEVIKSNSHKHSRRPRQS